jgi:hypothetical protein
LIFKDKVFADEKLQPYFTKKTLVEKSDPYIPAPLFEKLQLQGSDRVKDYFFAPLRLCGEFETRGQSILFLFLPPQD